MSKIRYMSALTALLLSFSLAACDNTPTTISESNTINTALSAELDEATRLNLQSAQNSILQARNTYFQVTAQLITVSTNVEAFQKVQSDVLPPMLAAANSLISADTSEDTERLKSDYQNLYSEVVAQMLKGINNNLQIYQGFIEGPQALDGQGPTSATTALEDLGALFQATESTEQFVTQLSQFDALLTDVSSQLNGIRSQQNLVINGTVKFTGLLESEAEFAQAYQTLVASLTRVEFFNQIRDLAKNAFGEENVAQRQSELTPDQSNPNLVNMVVRESESRYRLIRQENGQLLNEIVEDSRGLSAADFLNQSNVVVVRESE